MHRLRYLSAALLLAVTFLPVNVLAEGATHVDLSQDERPSLNSVEGGHVLSNPWWQNFDIHGFGSAGYYDTGENGTVPNGSFSIKEASIFVHADVWQDVEMFIEVQTNRLGKDDDLFTRTGEVHVHFRNLRISDSFKLGLKVGRFDIPFGEEYLSQDSIDNPLITTSASYVYGWDEGLLGYADIGGVGVIAAISDGTDARSEEDDNSKALNLKVYGDVTEKLYLSFSAMHNGDAVKSAVEFGGSHFEPTGASHVSTLGVSSSERVNGSLVQLDGKYDLFGHLGYLSAYIGYAEQHDDDTVFERDFRWFGVELYREISANWYLVTRYSEIGTYDSDEGYHFDGKIYAGGNSSFGYDTDRFRRLGVGLGFVPNPRVVVKFELGRDWFDLIDASSLGGTNGREFAAAELAVGF
jgi:hypothetical protein